MFFFCFVLKIDTCNEKSKARERKASAYALQQQLKRPVSWALGEKWMKFG